MKILIIRNYPSLLDFSKNTYNIQEIGLAKSISKLGHDCDVLLWTDREEKNLDIIIAGYNSKVRLFYRKGLSILKNALFFGCHDLLDMYDVLQVCEYNQIQSWLIARKYPQKTIIYHGPYYSAFNTKYNTMAFFFDLFFLKDYKKLGTPILTKSFLAEEYLKEKKLKNTLCVGVGLDVDYFESDTDEKNSFINEIESRKENKILYVGKIEPRRNPLFLVDILSELCSYIDTILIIVGNGTNKNINAFFNYAKKKGVIDRIMYCDRIEQKYMAALYNSSKALVLPTFYDIFGMVILEAMYFGSCVFTSINGGSNMLIENEDNGFVINGYDSKEWASSIKKVINNERELKRIGSQARRTIKNGFIWDNLSVKFLDAYQHICNTPQVKEL